MTLDEAKIEQRRLERSEADLLDWQAFHVRLEREVVALMGAIVARQRERVRGGASELSDEIARLHEELRAIQQISAETQTAIRNLRIG